MKTKNILLLILLSITIPTFAQKKIIILHTNDTHSQIEPIPSWDKYNASMGGVVNRKAIIDSVRRVEKNVLLLDAGDFVQGTPYYNMFHGRVETEAMDMMKYDVGTIGNHEFDEGIDSLKMLVKEFDYPIICCNYDFSNTVLKGLIKPYTIIKKDGVKIGIIGVGVDPEGLIQKSKYEGMTFKPIIETVNHYATILRNKKKCDLIICLSHIGYDDDKTLGKASEYIDIIIGGHSHTFMKAPEIVKNKNDKDVLIYQAGGRGAVMGAIEVNLDKKQKK